MARSTSLILPSSASSDRLRSVVGRLLDLSLLPSVYVSNHTTDFDPTEPSSPDNPWHLAFSAVDRHRISYRAMEERMDDLSYVMLDVEYLPGLRQRWSLHREDAHSPSVLWSGYTNPLVIAVGERLARFFGGELTRDDSRESDPAFTVKPARCAFPPKKKGQTSNERWYQFQNALADCSPLSVTELDRAVARDGQDDQRFAALRAKLAAHEAARALAKAMPQAKQRQPRVRM